ncbi:MAG TPA: hypothetical protein VF510_17815 [Ktedonobacterales bacterium]
MNDGGGRRGMVVGRYAVSDQQLGQIGTNSAEPRLGNDAAEWYFEDKQTQ